MARSVLGVATLAAALVAGCTSSKTPDPSCPSGEERCDNQCVDPATYYAADPANCGGCGISCGAGTCAAGACLCGGLTLCAESNPRCTDLQTDPSNCSGCGNRCPRARESCVGGSCQCAAPYSGSCLTYCANFQGDPRNCGGCGNVCLLLNEDCNAGTCACPSGTTACPVASPTACRNLSTDPSNCGSCGNVCPTGATCSGGICRCSGTVCNNVCVDPNTNEANCGGCGHVCPAGATCVSGSCPCPAGPIQGCRGACCAGGSSACCGNGACETQHSNGVDQSFFDCVPLGTFDQTQALKAARAWRQSGTLVPGNGILCGSMDCIGWQTADACGTWCYGQDAWRGRVTVNAANPVCLCPPDGSPHWN